jgi:hypothetical protein
LGTQRRFIKHADRSERSAQRWVEQNETHRRRRGLARGQTTILRSSLERAKPGASFRFGFARSGLQCFTGPARPEALPGRQKKLKKQSQKDPGGSAKLFVDDWPRHPGHALRKARSLRNVWPGQIPMRPKSAVPQSVAPMSVAPM